MQLHQEFQWYFFIDRKSLTFFQRTEYILRNNKAEGMFYFHDVFDIMLLSCQLQHKAEEQYYNGITKKKIRYVNPIQNKKFRIKFTYGSN